MSTFETRQRFDGAVDDDATLDGRSGRGRRVLRDRRQALDTPGGVPPGQWRGR